MQNLDNQDPQLPSAELLQWSVARSDVEITVFLEGEIDLSLADGLTTLLAELLEERPPKLVVDLAGVSFMDSTGIRSLLIAEAAASRTGRAKLVVRRPTHAILRLFTICGVTETLLEDPAGDAPVAR